MGSRAVIDDYGGRRTFFPPFIHQDANECTMTAAQMAANVACCGTLEATNAEVKRLAATQGPRPDGGYNTRAMIRALGARYGLAVHNESIPIARWKKRLANGQVVVLGFHYQDLDRPFRAPRFKESDADHRVLALGYDEAAGTTRMIDPLQDDPNHRGIDVPVEHLHRVVQLGDWSDWEVWIKEAQNVLTTLTIGGRFAPVRTATLKAGVTHRFWLAATPGAAAATRRPTEDLKLDFDMVGRIRQSDPRLEPSGHPFIRIATPGRPLDGLWVQVTGDVLADITVGQPAPANDIAAAVAEAVQRERDAWIAWLATSPEIVPPPDNDPGTALGDG